MASSRESASFLSYNRRRHRSFIYAICILSLFMLVIYHQYGGLSTSHLHLDKTTSGWPGAVGNSMAKEPMNPSSATIGNGYGNGKPETSPATSKTDNPKTSAASMDSKGGLTITNAGLDSTRVALLLETRPLPHLPALLAHFISVLPAPWILRFVGSPEANSLISPSSSLSAHVKTGKLVISELPAKYKIADGETLSATLTDLTFYKDFLAPAEWLLVFQSDSIICSASERSIEEWIAANYSWVGAPWNIQTRGGNGGLSLRHIPPIIEILEKEVRTPGSLWEDRWICDRLSDLDATRMPEAEIGVTFSVESQWYEKPFGYHLIGSGQALVPDIWNNKERREHILQYCPEIKIILDMDLIRETQRLTKELENLKSPSVDAEKKGG